MLLPAQERHDPGEHPENVRRLPGVVERLRAGPEWDPPVRALPEVRARRGCATQPHARVHRDPRGKRRRCSCLARHRHARVAGEFPGMPARHRCGSGGGRCGGDGGLPPSRQPVRADPTARPSQRSGPGHGLLSAQPRLDRRSLRATHVRHRAGRDPRLGRASRERNAGDPLRDPSVLFVSLHQWPLYPGTGWLDEIGERDGRGHTVNIPLPPGSRDAEYLEALDRVALPIIEQFAPSCSWSRPARTGTHRTRSLISCCPCRLPGDGRARRGAGASPEDRARRGARGWLQRLDAADARPVDRRRPRRLRRRPAGHVRARGRPAAGRLRRAPAGRHRGVQRRFWTGL